MQNVFMRGQRLWGAHTWVTLSVGVGTAAACATLPPRDDPDVGGMLAAALTGAMLHVRNEVPAGPIAIDTVNAGVRTLLKAIAAQHNFAVGDIGKAILCDAITGECLLRDATGPSVVVALVTPARGFTDTALTEFPTLEVQVHWRRGPPGVRTLAGRIIEVRLGWTPRDGWTAIDSRTTWKLH